MERKAEQINVVTCPQCSKVWSIWKLAFGTQGKGSVKCECGAVLREYEGYVHFMKPPLDGFFRYRYRN